jgi:hypothetical protein
VKSLALMAAALGVLVFAKPALAAPCTLPHLNHDPPQATVIATFDVLRRHATPADAWPAPQLLPPDLSFNEDWFRRTGSLGGMRFYLLPGQKATPCGAPTKLFVGATGGSGANGGSVVSGGAGLSFVKRFGEWAAFGSSGGSLVSGLLPDGVAKVTVTYPKGRGHPGGVAYPHAVRKTVHVRNNMALFKLGRTPDDASSPSRQIWRSKSGRVIRRAPGNP